MSFADIPCATAFLLLNGKRTLQPKLMTAKERIEYAYSDRASRPRISTATDPSCLLMSLYVLARKDR